jgi:predicted nucleic acid-binding protein
LLVLLDTTVLTNFALVGLTSIPKDLWGDNACTTSEVLEEYAAGVETGKLPRADWTQLKTIILSSEEQLFGVQMFPNLGRGERTCLVIATLRHAMLATDDHLARRVAKLQRIQFIGTVGVLKNCVQSGLLSLLGAQQKLDQMIAAGYYSPVSKLDAD